MTDQLDRIDRTTLDIWRLSRTFRWPFLALAAACILHLGMYAIGPSLFAYGGYFRGGVVSVALPWVFMRFLISVLGGIAMGGIVGAKVWSRPVRAAAVVAAAYTALALLPTPFKAPLAIILDGAWDYGLGASFALVALTLLAIPIAVWRASAAARRRTAHV